MPARKPPAPVRRKHSLGNLRRAHPASGATWNVQVVRGKMSSKCLWHACRALILGLTLMLLGAGMATIGYYADQLSVASEVRGNATVRVKNESKGFHLNNLSYVGPIVMGFGGFIVVASCVMTFEARDSAAKVVPARLKATTNSKITVRNNPSSAASQRRAQGIQHQATRWDHHLGVFRSSPAEPPPPAPPLDRQALTAALVHFSKSISSSSRFSPKLRRLSHTGSVPNLSTLAPHPYANSANLSHLLSPNRKPLHLGQRRHRHHHHQQHSSFGGGGGGNGGRHMRGRDRGARISSSLVQRATRESAMASLLQPLPPAHRLYWHAHSIDESGRLEGAPSLGQNLSRNMSQSQASRIGDRTKRSDTAKRHVLSRQKPIEREDEERERARGGYEASPLGHRRSSTLSDSSFSGRWTYRCASITSRASSMDSRKIQVDMHSPEAMPKSILRSPKRFNSCVSTTPSVEKEFRSQLSVCSEPPAPIRQLSGQSSLEPCLPEESPDLEEKNCIHLGNSGELDLVVARDLPAEVVTSPTLVREPTVKKQRPATLPLTGTTAAGGDPNTARSFESHKVINAINATNATNLHRSNSSRTFYRAKDRARLDERDDSVCYTRSGQTQETSSLRDQHNYDSYDSLRVINERRHKLLKTESETALIERKASTAAIKTTMTTATSATATTVTSTTMNFDNSGSQQQTDLDLGPELEPAAGPSELATVANVSDTYSPPTGTEAEVQRCQSVALTMEPSMVGQNEDDSRL